MSDHVNGPELSGARLRLFEAAVASFATQGFHGTTTRDIAAAAGMSPAALYVHHRSKEELLHLISARGHAQALRVCEEAVAAPGTVREQLGRLAADFARFHALNPTVARIVNYELASLAPEHHAEVMGMRHAMDAVVRDLVTRGVEEGVFDTPSPRMTAAAILSLGIDVARWYDPAGGWFPDEVAQHYRVLALRMVGAA